MKTQKRTKSFYAVLLSTFITLMIMILGILYIEKSENCFLYLETGFLKIMMHGRECK